MTEPTSEKSNDANPSELETGGEGITPIALRRRALARKVVSRRLEREKTLEQAKRAETGGGDAPK